MFRWMTGVLALAAEWIVFALLVAAALAAVLAGEAVP